MWHHRVVFSPYVYTRECMNSNPTDTATAKLLDGLTREELDEEINDVQRRMAELSTHLEFLQLALRLKESRLRRDDRVEPGRLVDEAAALGAVAATTGPGRPPLKAAVLLVMGEAPNKVWTPTELYAAVAARGWAPETASAKTQVSNALQRLRRSHQVKKVGTGRYELATPTRTDGPQETGLFVPGGPEEG